MSITYVDYTLLAMLNLLEKEIKEPSEEEITLAMWNLDKNRWGLRGYEETHPNHKETHKAFSKLAGSKRLPEKDRGLVAKRKATHYYLTDLGIIRAIQAKTNISGEAYSDTVKSNRLLHQQLSFYTKHYALKQGFSSWFSAASFLQLGNISDPQKVQFKISAFQNLLAEAKAWFKRNPDKVMLPSSKGGGKAISIQDIYQLTNALQHILKEFEREIESIT